MRRRRRRPLLFFEKRRRLLFCGENNDFGSVGLEREFFNEKLEPTPALITLAAILLGQQTLFPHFFYERKNPLVLLFPKVRLGLSSVTPFSLSDDDASGRDFPYYSGEKKKK